MTKFIDFYFDFSSPYAYIGYKEIKKLESEKKALEAIINNDKNTINQLNNIDSLESFARENYGHKKENETIYIIETQD